MEPATALTILALVAATFAATNVDNLVLLVGWLLHPGSRPVQIFVGYVTGMSGVLALSGLLGLLGSVVPVRWVGLLGFVPLLLGVRMLWMARGSTHAAPPAAGGATLIAVASTQLANGVDTVLVFAPLLADSRGVFDAVVAAGFVLTTAAWFFLARLLTVHASKLEVVRRVSTWVAPVIMMTMGLYILSNTASDTLPG